MFVCCISGLKYKHIMKHIIYIPYNYIKSLCSHVPFILFSGATMEIIVSMVVILATIVETIDDAHLPSLPKECHYMMYCQFDCVREGDTFPFQRDRRIHGAYLGWLESCSHPYIELELPVRSFSKMANLKQLYIVGSIKTHYTQKTFQGLTKIERLEISVLLMRVSDDLITFDPVRSLRTLNH